MQNAYPHKTMARPFSNYMHTITLIHTNTPFHRLTSFQAKFIYQYQKCEATNKLVALIMLSTSKCVLYNKFLRNKNEIVYSNPFSCQSSKNQQLSRNILLHTSSISLSCLYFYYFFFI